MSRRITVFMALAALVIMLSAIPTWADANYVFTTFDGPNSAGGGTTANGINNNDQIVGFSVDAGDNVTNWVRNTDGSFNILPLPAGSLANGVNITPTVVGQNGANAFAYTVGVYTNLPLVNGTTTAQAAFGINDGGTIVGQYTDGATGTSPGFVYAGGQYTALNPVPTAVATNAQGINNHGLVAGFFTSDGITSHGFFYNTNSSTYQLVGDPNVPNFLFSQMLGINDHGIVAGYYGTTNGSQHGFLYDMNTNTYTFLDDPLQGIINGVSITQITGISDDGEITGFYIDANGVQHGFYAVTAVPEPASLMLLGTSVLGLAGRGRRKLSR